MLLLLLLLLLLQVSGALATVLVGERKTSPASETKPGKPPRVRPTMDVQTIGDVPATQTAGVVEVGVCKKRTYSVKNELTATPAVWVVGTSPIVCTSNI
jgi:hypothetical protein